MIHPFDWDASPTGKLDCLREQASLMQCLYKNRQDLYQQCLGILCLFPELLTFTFNTNTLPPSWATWRDGDTVGVTINGTRNETGMWGSHFTGLPGKRVKLPSPLGGEEDVTVHAYHHAQASILYTQLRTDWGNLDGKRILVCGHSFGASVSNFIGLFLARDGLGERTAVVTFGEPRGVGYGAVVPPKVKYRCVNTGDLVTAVPMGWTLGLFDENGERTRWRGGIPWSGRGTQVMPMERSNTRVKHNRKWFHVGDGDLLLTSGKVRPLKWDESGWPFWDDDAHSLRVYINHVMEGTISRLRFNADRYGASADSLAVLAIGEQAATLPPVQTDGPPWGPADYRTPAEVQAELFRPGAPPLTLPELRTAEAVAILPSGVFLTRSSNRESIVMATSGIWDITLCINNDIYGKSVTMSWNGSTSFAQAKEAAFDLAYSYANLLGRPVGADTTAMTDAEPLGRDCPAIEFVRIRDAKNPREGQVYRVPKSRGLASPAPDGAVVGGPTDNSADPLWNSLSTSLYGVSASVPNKRARYTLTVCGQPDRAVFGGRIKYDTNYGGTIPGTLDQRLRQLLEMICPEGGGQWGMSGQDTSVAEKTITKFEPDADNRLLCTCTAHGYVTGDKVKITRAKTKYARKVWEVDVVDANSFALVGSQVTPLQVPTGSAKARLWQTRDGIRQVAFYPFLRPDYLPNQALPFEVRKRAPGRRITLVSFRHKGKRS